MQTVNVRLAFEFTCAECGKLNFARSVLHEFTPQEREDVADEIGELPRMGEWLTHPETVQCDACGCEFQAVDSGELVSEEN